MAFDKGVIAVGDIWNQVTMLINWHWHEPEIRRVLFDLRAWVYAQIDTEDYEGDIVMKDENVGEKDENTLSMTLHLARAEAALFGRLVTEVNEGQYEKADRVVALLERLSLV